MKYCRVKEERNIMRTIKRKKAICVGHSLFRNSLVKYVIEGDVKGKLEGQGKGEEEVSSWCMALRKTEIMEIESGRTRFGRS
jgi:hypothetical protein